MEIPFIKNYRICKNGDVYHYDSNICTKLPTFKEKYLKVVINGIVYRVDYLIMITYVGIIDLPIIYKNDNTSDCFYENLSYKVESVEVIGDSLYINNIAVEFRRIPGSTDFITKNGVVFSYHLNRFKGISHRKNEYCAHSIFRYGESKKNYTHRLVYETWVGQIVDDLVIDHLDGNVWNNDIYNLEIVTSSINNMRAYEKGLKSMKWDRTKIELLCLLMSKNYHINDIYNLFDATTQDEKNVITLLVSDIKLSRCHTSISEKYDIGKYDPKKNHYTVLYDYKIDIIKNLINNGFSQQKVADITGVSRSVVENICLKCA